MDEGTLEPALKLPTSSISEVKNDITYNTNPLFAFVACYGVTFSVTNYIVFHYEIFSVLCYSLSSSVQHIPQHFVPELTLISCFF